MRRSNDHMMHCMPWKPALVAGDMSLLSVLETRKVDLLSVQLLST
jgi:hypothetical protein